ncbi:MAG: hypothetical protein Q8K58_04300 [Acidimicrobiales bacterium]|nr:hypothetical protein [Acidimicrobiales bacterium]
MSARTLLLAATTAFGVAAAVAILRVTEVSEPRLTLPVERPARTRPTAMRQTTVTTGQGAPTTQLSDTTASSPPGGGTTISAGLAYRWSPIAGVDEFSAPDAGGGLTAVAAVEGEGLIAVGGSRDAPLVLVSPDGLGWSRVDAAEEDLQGAALRDVAVVDGRLVAVGSLRGAPAAWTSLDAVQWSRVPVTDPANELGVGLLEALAQSPDGSVFAVGFSPGSAGIWALHDGRFEPESSARTPSVGQVLSDVVSTSKGVVAAGNDAEGQPIALRSTGEGTWSTAVLPAEGGRASVAALGEIGDVVVAVGYGVPGPLVWSSADAQSWSAVTAPTTSPGRPAGLYAVAPGPGGALAGGQRPGGPLCSSSTDGTSWSECDGEDGLRTAAVRDLLAVGAGFVAVGTSTPEDGQAGPAIWHVEREPRAAQAR